MAILSSAGESEHAVAWRQIKLEDGFAAKWGLHGRATAHLLQFYVVSDELEWAGLAV